MEKEREKSFAHASEYATDFTRLKQTLLRALENQNSSNEKVVSNMGKELMVLKNAIEASTAKLQSLERQQSEDKRKTPQNNEMNQILERLETIKRDQDIVNEGLKMQAHRELSITHGAYRTSVEEESIEVNHRRIHRLATLSMMNVSEIERRDCVSQFLLLYSNSKNWKTDRDRKLRTTVYVFQFNNIKFRTRMSFLYPFVNYLTQVIGVNRHVLGNVSMILRTTSVSSRVRKLCSCFNEMHITLGIHNSGNLWNYVYIFLKNMSTHYGQIQTYVGSRTRTNRQATRQKVPISLDEAKDVEMDLHSCNLLESPHDQKNAGNIAYSRAPNSLAARISSGSSARSSPPNPSRYGSGSSEGLQFQIQDIEISSKVSSKIVKSTPGSVRNSATSDSSLKGRKVKRTNSLGQRKRRRSRKTRIK